MEGIELISSKYPKYALFAGIFKGLVTSQFSKRSEEELRSDLTAIMNMLNKCMEVEVDSDDTGHIDENR